MVLIFLAWRKFWRDDLPLDAIDSCHLLPTLVTLHSRGVLSRYEPHWFVPKKPTGGAAEVNKFTTEAITAKRKPALPPKPKPMAAGINTMELDSDDKVRLKEKLLEEEKLLKDIEDLQIQVEKVCVYIPYLQSCGDVCHFNSNNFVYFLLSCLKAQQLAHGRYFEFTTPLHRNEIYNYSNSCRRESAANS